LSVIASISLDHTAVLGETVEAIAGEKAGIIKAGCPAVLYGQSAAVESVVRAKCAAENAPLTVSEPAAVTVESRSLDGQIIAYRERRGLRLNLLGEYQPYNAALALDAVDALLG
jgi:dihydrofolate synthase/folylpolyglutamate synthase